MKIDNNWKFRFWKCLVQSLFIFLIPGSIDPEISDIYIVETLNCLCSVSFIFTVFFQFCCAIFCKYLSNNFDWNHLNNLGSLFVSVCPWCFEKAVHVRTEQTQNIIKRGIKDFAEMFVENTQKTQLAGS